MATPVLPYPDMDFTPLDILTAEEMDEIVANVEYLKTFCGGLADGSNLSDGVIQARKLASGIGNYSTTEKDTGFTWIDGKHIYKKTISFGTLPNTSSKYVNINAEINFCVKIETIVYDNTSAHNTNGAYGAAGGGIIENALLTTNKTQLAITTDRDRSSLSAYITIYYTKN